MSKRQPLTYEDIMAARERRKAIEAEVAARPPTPQMVALTEYMNARDGGRQHGHRSLAGLSVAKTMAACERCGRAKIRYLAEKPEYTHEGRNGRRLAATYGVEYTPYESRSESSQEALGRREQERREGDA